MSVTARRETLGEILGKTMGKTLAALLLPALLAGCDAIYDDTKGWANRLEASLLQAANGEPDAAAEEPAPAAAQAQSLAETPAPPAVPVEPVTTVALTAPEAQRPAAVAAPEGAMAAASEALLASEDTPPLPEPKPAPQAESALPKAEPAKSESPTPAAETASAEQVADPVVAVVLHLSSLRSEEAAKRQWNSLQQSFPEPLGQLQAEIRRADLGDKGTFYRVLAGPLASRDNAAQVCAALKAKNASQYCRVLPQEPKS